MTYTARLPWRSAHSNEPGDQLIRTGRSATDWVPVGSSSRTTRTRSELSARAATMCAGTSGPFGTPCSNVSIEIPTTTPLRSGEMGRRAAARRRPPRHRVVATPLGRRALTRVHLVETAFLDLVRLLEERREGEEDRSEDGADGQRVEACVAVHMLIEERPHVRGEEAAEVAEGVDQADARRRGVPGHVLGGQRPEDRLHCHEADRRQREARDGHHGGAAHRAGEPDAEGRDQEKAAADQMVPMGPVGEAWEEGNRGQAEDPRDGRDEGSLKAKILPG